MDVDVRSGLLGATLENALRKSFYADLWRSVDVAAISRLDQLPSLPTISKELYRERFMSDFGDPGDSHYIVHTTGTTGPSLFRYRSLSEAELAEQIFRTNQRSSETVGLNVRGANHGLTFPMPGSGMVIPVRVQWDDDLQVLISLLESEFPIHGRRLRPEFLFGPSQDLFQLSQALFECGYEPPPGSISAIFSAGFMDAQQRYFIGRFFSAPITERYSLAEIFGGATAVSGGGPYLLDRHVIGEVVDDAGNQVEDGSTGELVLTELYPYVQMQPLIRYRTGDVVRLLDGGRTFTFQWLGRMGDSVPYRSQDGTSVLGFRVVADLLASDACVARGPVRTGLTLTSLDLGYPAFLMAAADEGESPTLIRLSIWLRYLPDLYLSATQEFVDRLWHSLAVAVDHTDVLITLRLRHSSRLAALTDNDRPRLVTAPQSLAGPPPLVTG
jgi:hypothetical protein